MDSNWRPDLTAGSVPASGSDPDWRLQLQPEARHRIVNKIMDTLKRHLPAAVSDGLNELQKIAMRFEEKIYSAAISQPDYLRRISLKMLSMESKTQGPQINPAANPNLQNLQNPNRMDPGLGSMQPQSSTNPAQSLAMQIPQNFQTNSTAPQNQSMPAGTQPPAGMNSLAQSVGPTGPLQADMYTNAQRRQQNQPQQNQLPQNQLLYQQNILRQKLHMQQQQQGLLQQSQMQMSSGLTGQSVAQQNSMTAGGGMQVQNNQLNPLQQQSLLRQQQQNSSMTTDLQQQQMQMQQNQMRQNQMINAHNMNNNMSSNMNNNMMVGTGGNNNNTMANMQQRRMQQMNQQMQPQQNQNQQHLLSQLQNQQPMQQGGNNNIINNNNMMQLQQQQQRPAAMLQTQNGGNNINNNSNNNNNNNNNLGEQQKQQFMQQQQQRVIQDVASSPASIDSTAQTSAPNELAMEEVYQKLKSMKELYFTDLRDIYQRLSMKLNGIDQSMVSDPKVVEQIVKMKNFKNALDRMLSMLQLNKQALQNQPNIKEKLNTYEKQIVSTLQSHKKIPQQQHQQSPAQQPPQPPAQQQQMPPAQQAVDPQQQFAPFQQQQQAQTQQIENQQMQGNFNMQNDQIQPNSGTFGVQNTMNGMNPPQTVGTGTATMMSHGSMMQQNLGLKQQQEAAAQQQQRLIQQNQMKQRHMQQLMQKQQLLQQQQQHLPLQQQPIQHQKQQQQQNNNTNNNQSSLLAAQLNNDSMADVKPRQAGLKPGPYQPLYQGMSSRTGYFNPQLKTGTNLPISSPQNLQSSSPQVSLPSPQIDQMKMERAHLQPASSPFIPSPSPPVAPSPLMPDETKPNPNPNLHNNSSAVAQPGQTGQPVPTQSVQSLAVGTPGISASPLLAEFTSPETANHVSTHVAVKSTDAETPSERLARALRAGSDNPAVYKLLKSAITDINSVVTMVDRVAGSAPGNGSRAAIGDNLVAMTKCRMQAMKKDTSTMLLNDHEARNLTDGNSGSGQQIAKRIKRDLSAMPLNDDWLDDGPGSVSDDEFEDQIEVHSTATSRVRMGKSEMVHGLMEEIKEINSRLIDTELTVAAEESGSILSTSEGTVIKCIYTAVAISPCLRSHFASSQLSPILPLRLLVPTGYPKCSPIILDKLPEEQSRDFDDLSTKARSRFRTSLRVLSEPLNLKEIARTWDSCARKVILEYAQKIGGGSFSTTYGTWKSCIGA